MTPVKTQISNISLQPSDPMKDAVDNMLYLFELGASFSNYIERNKPISYSDARSNCSHMFSQRDETMSAIIRQITKLAIDEYRKGGSE